LFRCFLYSNSFNRSISFWKWTNRLQYFVQIYFYLILLLCSSGRSVSELGKSKFLGKHQDSMVKYLSTDCTVNPIWTRVLSNFCNKFYNKPQVITKRLIFLNSTNLFNCLKSIIFQIFNIF